LTYTVFISHGWHDKWIARQMARMVQDSGASAFIDVFDIKKGDRIEERVREGLGACQELVALLTPWSVDRKWVWAEISAAWILRKRCVGVLYGVTVNDIESKHGGMACLAPTNVVALDEYDDYIAEMSRRAHEWSET